MKLILLTLVVCFHISSVNNIVSLVTEGVQGIFEDGLETIFTLPKRQHLPVIKMTQAFFDLRLPENAPTLLREEGWTCKFCQMIVNNILNGLITPLTVGQIICDLYQTMFLQADSNFCKLAIKLNMPTVNYIFKHSKQLSTNLICSTVFSDRTCRLKTPSLNWKVKIPKYDGNQMPPPPSLNSVPIKPLKILQLSDVHITPKYAVGSVSECGYVMCCKNELNGRNTNFNAGKWGSYFTCDIPPETYVNALWHINKTHKDIDLIYFTGDIVDHGIWNTTEQSNADVIEYVYKTLKLFFPNTVILPTIGNHESSPINLFPPPDIINPNISQRWLYDLLVLLWKPWLPAEALETVRKQGYYTYLVSKNFRVIALHNNICYKVNFWLYYNTMYLKDQLNWLVKILEESEKNKQFVHIIAHVAPGNKDCIEPWEISYVEIVTRFSHVIRGQFFGHTHTDELKVFFNARNRIPNNVGFNGGSLTTFQNYNPNYKLYTVHPESFEILEAESYIFNLTEANLMISPYPRWYRLYSLKKDFNLPDLRPNSVANLVKSFHYNQTRLKQYFKYYVRDADASWEIGCDKACQKNLKCQALTTASILGPPVLSDECLDEDMF